MFDFLSFFAWLKVLTFFSFLFLGLIEGRKKSPACEAPRRQCEKEKVDGRTLFMKNEAVVARFSQTNFGSTGLLDLVASELAGSFLTLWACLGIGS
ncbi:unnamed protein product [Linum tenue]|uniref:Uncharacterized protein n=1 Tax=Linum tenue TaxID=586396 RepID=A0AAV0PYI3_9ROSI|nr:unnamed protein product [Linum tenue]